MPYETGKGESRDHLVSPGSKHFEIFFENAPVMMWVLDQDGRVLRVNRRWREMLGYAAEEVMGRQPFLFTTAAGYRRFVDIEFPDFWQHGGAKDRPYEFVTKGGEVIPVAVDAEAVVDPWGNRFALVTARLKGQRVPKRRSEMLAVVDEVEAIALSVRMIARAEQELTEAGAEQLKELVASTRDMSRAMRELTDAVMESLERS